MNRLTWIVAMGLTCAVAVARQEPAPNLRHGFLGTNDSSNTYYGNSGRWADAGRAFSGFFKTGDTPATGVKYGQDGYPLTPAGAISYMGGYPAGQYKVTWQGDATLEFRGGKWTPGPSGHDGILTLTKPDQFQQLFVHSNSPARPLHDLHIWAPGYGPGGPVYRKEFLDILRPFASIRTMDLQNMNDNAEVHWSDRVQPTTWDQTSHGVAIELLVEEANEAGVDLWVNVPAKADDDYCRNMARVVHAARGQVHVEYGNEVWNWGMKIDRKYVHGLANDPAGAFAYDGKIEDGKVVPYTDSAGKPKLGTDQNTRDARCCAERARQVMLIFRDAFKDRPGDLHTMFAGQEAWDAWAKNGVEWIAAKYGDHPFDELAIASYFYPWDYLKIPKATPQDPNPQMPSLDQVFAALDRFIDTDLPKFLDKHAELCQRYGMKLVIYEGGQHIYPAQTPFSPNDLMYRAQLDPRMGAAYEKSINLCRAKGVTLWENFSLIGDWSKWGFWCVKRNLADDNPRWQALVRESAKSNQAAAR